MSNLTSKSSLIQEEVRSLGGELIAVSKTFGSEKIKEVYEAGISDFGENYLGEAIQKTEDLAELKIRWHYLGRVQSGSLNKLLNKFYLIQTIASLDHLKKINQKTESKQKVLIQIRHDSDLRDYGVSEEDLKSFVQEACKMDKIILSGLMFLPPVEMKGQDLELAFLWAREQFDKLRELCSQEWAVLSMGMSGDYRDALKNKATHVRVGRAVFGER